jgi:iron complex outermembrane receptor protein
MKKVYKSFIFTLLAVALAATQAVGQITLRGKVQDAATGEDLISATVALSDTSGQGGGTATDYEGNFTLRVDALPVTLRVSYTGYATQTVEVTSADQRIDVRLETSENILGEVTVAGQRIDDRQKAAPLTVENMDAIAIRETPAVSFYNGLGNLKGVDLTTASLGFTIINTRGFNSTSPVRSLQLIDGVDNQAPGLNFSLGNFLGAPDLDVNGVDLVAGASGPFYGPNAFNGVISIKSKDPFVHKGLSVSLKGGERDLFEGAIRWADALKGKSGHDWFAYKLNFFYLRANDWEANNYDPVSGTTAGPYYTPAENPGRFDAVNIYGDEYYVGNDATGDNPWSTFFGQQIYHRTGYRETDLVDYNTRNYKANAVLQFRLDPKREFESPELVLASNFGSGTTVYQGDNRFSLRDILFFQNRIELRQTDKFFLRAYATHEDAGNSFDPYFTALRLQESAKSNEQFKNDYTLYWGNQQFKSRMNELGYPQVMVDPITFELTFDYDAAAEWFRNYRDTLANWHARALANANLVSSNPNVPSNNFLQPGTPEFQREFDRITSLKSGSYGGTRFYDKSALYHVHGEYQFRPLWLERWVVGGNYRLYTPTSHGTIFSDSVETRTLDANGNTIDSTFRTITNSEFGFYTGVEKKFYGDRLMASGTVRLDKNENYELLVTPAASLVYQPNRLNFLRLSFSSAIRNPTLSDQYLHLNVGRAILLGNLEGFDSLVTLESFREAINRPNPDFNQFDYFTAPPIRPEKVKTFEVGYRTTVFNRLYIDAGYYYNIYNDFIGYNIGLKAPISNGQLDIGNLQVYRVSANSANTVTTQGFNVGMNFYFRDFYQVSGNYSWNRLNKLDEDDPIIPAFNTPEHKFNVGLSGRDLPLFGLKRTGFNIVYKWIQGFTFEGSPQFTGLIPAYDMVDAQWNVTFDRIHTTFKLGATNLFGLSPLFRTEAENNGNSGLNAMFNNRQFQTYGGPRIGRLAYLSVLYNFNKKS